MLQWEYKGGQKCLNLTRTARQGSRDSCLSPNLQSPKKFLINFVNIVVNVVVNVVFLPMFGFRQQKRRVFLDHCNNRSEYSRSFVIGYQSSFTLATDLRIQSDETLLTKANIRRRCREKLFSFSGIFHNLVRCMCLIGGAFTCSNILLECVNDRRNFKHDSLVFHSGSVFEGLEGIVSVKYIHK